MLISSQFSAFITQYALMFLYFPDVMMPHTLFTAVSCNSSATVSSRGVSATCVN